MPLRSRTLLGIGSGMSPSARVSRMICMEFRIMVELTLAVAGYTGYGRSSFSSTWSGSDAS